jgi:hypothetical protein
VFCESVLGQQVVIEKSKFKRLLTWLDQQEDSSVCEEQIVANPHLSKGNSATRKDLEVVRRNV